jgi:hypothetical protein
LAGRRQGVINDDLLGHADIPLDALYQGTSPQPIDRRFDLAGADGQKAGEIHLEISIVVCSRAGATFF